ncbi:MAG TPA: TldD/PmbA family protein [Gemmatimonadales bacterium]|nr:TldD/PmbA family protein [Gemmatimonadales bacterium]
MTPRSRRAFLSASATAVGALALTTLPRPLLATVGSRPEPVPPIDDPRLKGLALRGVESARAAGASYADVRLTHTRVRNILSSDIQDTESMSVGVRALVNGYWGFASGPVWSPDELARLGREAVHQAKANALGPSRVVELAPVAAVPDQHWTMPVAQDPFAISPFQMQDYLNGVEAHFARRPGVVVGLAAYFVVQDKAFASSAGSYCTQRLYQTNGFCQINVISPRDGQRLQGGVDCLSFAGLGWELFTAPRLPQVREHTLQEEIEREIDAMLADHRLPIKPVDVGRYDVVFSPRSVAELVFSTFGPATQLDRALGYEANASGTSYLNKPLEMLGTYQAGAPALTLTADRSTPGAVGTVRWDDEGVAPDAFPIVKDGALVDFQTTRESAGWLKEYYAKTGKPFRSHGCACAPQGVDAPLLHTPNLVLAPGPAARDFDDLVADLSDGIAVKALVLEMDFQNVTGLALGRGVYEVKKGKRVAMLPNAGLLFRSPELWKGLVALGGAASARRYGRSDNKGEPVQSANHSITAPPAAFKQLTLIDPLRKA